VIIPFDVIEELDKFKTNSDDLGRNARTVIRHLDSLRIAGKPGGRREDSATGMGRRVRVVLEEDQKLCPGLTANTPDNRIICCAFSLLQEGKRVVFITKDINARIKSDAMGLAARISKPRRWISSDCTPAGARWRCRRGRSTGSFPRNRFV
jgi:PhoH-like ATPase